MAEPVSQSTDRNSSRPCEPVRDSCSQTSSTLPHELIAPVVTDNRLSRSEILTREIGLLKDSLRRIWPEETSHGSPARKEALTLRGLLALETKLHRGFTPKEYDPALFAFPLIGVAEVETALGELVKKELAEIAIDGSVRSTPTGKIIAQQHQQLTQYTKTEARFARLRQYPEQHLHESMDSSAWIALSELILAHNDGEALARTVLENGGRVAIIHHQQSPLAGSQLGGLAKVRADSKTLLRSLANTYSDDQLCRLNIGGDLVGEEGYALDAADFWLRDRIGFFGGCERPSAHSQRGHYFGLQQDILSGGLSYFSGYQEVQDSHLSLRRTRLAIQAVGGFFYPIGEDSMAVGSAIFDRHNRDSENFPGLLRGCRLNIDDLRDELSLLGRPNVLLVPPLFTNPRHIDTSICQVGTQVFVADVSSRHNEALVGAKEFAVLGERQRAIEETLSEQGVAFVRLPMPFIEQHREVVPLHTINVLQFFDREGRRHVVVPWIDRQGANHAKFKEHLDQTESQISEALISAGATAVHFQPFRVTNGGLRCATSHIPDIAVSILRKTHELG